MDAVHLPHLRYPAPAMPESLQPPPPRYLNHQVQCQMSQWTDSSRPPPLPPSYSTPHSHLPSYPPYPTQPHLPHFLPQHPQPLRHAYPPQPYQAPGQQNWGHHQNWDYSAHGVSPANEEDWAAKARAWATADSSMESHQPSSQFPSINRTEDQNHAFHNQPSQSMETRFPDAYSSLPALNHQMSGPSATHDRPPTNYLQEHVLYSSAPSYYTSDISYSSAPSYYVSEEPVRYGGNDFSMIAKPSSFPSTTSAPANPSIYQQEVPSSYSSLPGHVEASSNKLLHAPLSLPLPISSTEGKLHSQHPPLHPDPHHIFKNQPSANSPLNFEGKISLDHDSHHEIPYHCHEQTATSGHAWNPSSITGNHFPPISPLLSPSLPAHPVSSFGRIPGPTFRPTVPSITAFNPGAATAFPVEANGVPNISERPKKASVPNWLREEIIKNKAVISNSIQGHMKQGPLHQHGEENSDVTYENDDQADTKSIDSRSNEEEEDEDDVEAARTAAINQEIKRLLTEVLLKVTDELFDEIATKVLSEDNFTEGVDHVSIAINLKAQQSSPTPSKTASKALIPTTKPSQVDNQIDQSSFGPSTNVLGLANYASDSDDEAVHDSDALKKEKEDSPEGTESISKDRCNEVLKPHDTVENNEDKKRKASSDPDNESLQENGVKGTLAEMNKIKPEMTTKKISSKRSERENSESKDVRNMPLRNDEHKDKGNVAEHVKSKSERKHPHSSISKGEEERYPRKEEKVDRNGSNENDEIVRNKGRHSDIKKNSSNTDNIDNRRQNEKVKRESSRDDSVHKKDHARDADRQRKCIARESEKHKRHHSPSISREDSLSSGHASGDEASDKLKRKSHPSRCSRSPSPSRSRRRQVSRSPHSRKHTQRRHSPHSSHQSRRRSRSRSFSPIRRRRK